MARSRATSRASREESLKSMGERIRLGRNIVRPPAGLGRFIEANSGLFGWAFRKGRRVRSGTIHWFLMLYVLAAFRPIRRTTLRHQREAAPGERGVWGFAWRGAGAPEFAE